VTEPDTDLHSELSRPSFQTLLQSVYDPIVLTAQDGTIIDANGRACTILSQERQTVCGRNIKELVGGFDADVLQQVTGALQGQKHVVLLDAHCFRSDGTTFPAEIAVSDSSITEDGPLCFCLRDITEKRKLQTIADDTVQRTTAGADLIDEKVKAIRTLTHEMSNPLQVVLSMVEIEGDAKYKDHLHAIAETMKKLRAELHSESVAVAEVLQGSNATTTDGLISAKPRSILIVDDEKPLRELFQTLLEGSFEGLDIKIAGSGAKALEEFEADHQSIIILDLLMPGMNGEEVFNRIAALCEKEQWEMPAVIFCTGFGLPATVRQAIKAEAIHGVLHKPVKRTSLVGAIRKRIEEYEIRHSK
jgi:PAS domain S-box-containing protein